MLRKIWNWLKAADVPGGVPHGLWMLTMLVAVAAMVRSVLA